MRREDELVGIIEETVREARLVDPGKREFQIFKQNAPSFSPDRRKFLGYAAVVAGEIVLLGKILLSTSGCAAPTAQFGERTYGGWEAYLITQDLIRGPSLMVHPDTGRPGNFEAHRQRPMTLGWGSVDYDIPIGTPLVLIADAYGKIRYFQTNPGNALSLIHSFGYRSAYSHLDRYAKIVENTPDFDKLDQLTITKLLENLPQLNKLIIVAYSGNSGRPPPHVGIMPEHLDLNIRKRSRSDEGYPGLDSFKLGIDQKNPIGGKDQYGLDLGGRPVYWDGVTEIDHYGINPLLLQESRDTLARRVKESDELDQATKNEILKRQDSLVELRHYLGQRVLLKKPGADGLRYEFVPGSLMYALMLEFYGRNSRNDFVAMLPFIFPDPRVKVHYQKANPGLL